MTHIGFDNYLPVRIRFGAGVVSRLAESLSAEGVRRPFILVDANVLALPQVENALADVTNGGAEIVLRQATNGEPTVASVDELGVELEASKADAIVAIGGGSVLDAAKGARIVACHGGSIARFCWPGDPEPISPFTMPFIAIPTTAGTGSEVTGGVVLVDPERRMKVAAPSPENRARYALVDPELTYSLPPGPTLWGGLDALAQSISPATVSCATPVGDALALEGTRYAARALPAVVRDPGDLDARAELMCASLLAGLAMNVAEAGSEHSLAHPLGVLHGVPHGLSVGVVLAEAMEHDRQFVPERFERIADALGAPADGSSDGSRAVATVRELLAAVRCPTLAELGVCADDVDVLAEAALAGWIPVSPGPWTIDDIRRAYLAALAVPEARGAVAPASARL